MTFQEIDSTAVRKAVEIVPLTLKIGWFLVAFAATCLAFWVAYRVVYSHQQGWSFKAWIADLNTTTYRIVISIWLSVAVVITLMVGVVLGAQGILKQNAMQENVVDSILFFLFGMMGLDVASFVAKRTTYKPSPPNEPDIEDAAAGATVPPEEPKPLADLKHAPAARPRTIQSDA